MTLRKWNESGFRPPLCTYRLNWARRTSWGWWDDWDDTVLQTQDSKFEPWRSEAEHATSRSRRRPTILTFTRGWGRNNLVSFKPPRPEPNPGVKGSGANHYPRAPARYDLEMTLPWAWDNSPIKSNTYPCHHVYLAWVSTYLFLYHPNGQGYLNRWPLVTLTMCRKSADHLKVTWYIIRLKTNWSTKVSRGGGGVQVGPRSKIFVLFQGRYHRLTSEV